MKHYYHKLTALFAAALMTMGATVQADDATIVGFGSLQDDAVKYYYPRIYSGVSRVQVGARFTADMFPAGRTLVGARVALPLLSPDKVSIELRTKATKEAFYTQTLDLDEYPAGYNYIKFDQPVDISAYEEVYAFLVFESDTERYSIPYVELAENNNRADYYTTGKDYKHICSSEELGAPAAAAIQLITEGAAPVGMPQYDLTLSNCYMDPFSCVGGKSVARFKVSNQGSKTVHSFVLTGRIGDRVIAQQEFTGIEFATGANMDVTLNINTEEAADASYVQWTIDRVEGQMDEIPTNNTWEVLYTIHAERVFPRTIFFEKFTGAYCPNCPIATKAILRNTRDYEGQFTYINEYGYDRNYTSYASSVRNFPGFTDLAMELRDILAPTYAPALLIDRQSASGPTPELAYVSASGITKNLIRSHLAMPSYVSIDFTESFYDPDTRELEVALTGEVLNGLDNLKVSIFLTQDHIRGAQALENGDFDYDYDHKHVLRDRITDASVGDDLYVNADGTYSVVYNAVLQPEYGYASAMTPIRLDDMNVVCLINTDDGHPNANYANFCVHQSCSFNLGKLVRGEYNTEGVNTVIAPETPAAEGTFTLDGKRISDHYLTPGTYIRDGKKVIVK